MADRPPVVLVFAGNDPSGGAGIAADIEALAANGCYPAPVITALTVQDTTGVSRVEPVAPELVEQQARAVLNDLPVAVIKTGLLANAGIATVVAELAVEYSVPLVIDPVLASGGGQTMTSDDLVDAYIETLFPHCLLTTPNASEARTLGHANEDKEMARNMIAAGCRWVLITGGHKSGDELEHELYDGDGLARRFYGPRLPGEFHGSGCTLASSCAAGIARGQAVEVAIASALTYTHRTLEHALSIGRGQRLPNRLPH